MKGINHFRVLGILANATPEEIKAAYRRRARETHPDHGGTSGDFGEVQEAYETLSDALKRALWEESYVREAASLGHYVCAECFAVNRVRSVKRGASVRCAGCKARLEIDQGTREERYQDALREQVSDVVLTLGAEGGALAKDAIVAAADGIRRKLKIHRGR